MLFSDVAPLPEVARNLGLDQSTAYRWLYSGKIPAQRVGSHWYVAKSDLPQLRSLAKKINEQSAEKVAE
jgi:excisionase family DNA binding protein